ncbi:calcium/sodium antiporter [Aurantimonas sp. DM33-3]|uniref:calcium/sodium antiporter n=1 Tax=Aurantimonas sp. DM33-3 TaxID=2766955 RepID=UPI0016529FF8|nr:calcium/sodium antiporter [Aurantimonas sp. DM33-3]MBC6715973.1 calcium/sodium antiporter [Aurantimonas sp. DM33-3]
MPIVWDIAYLVAGAVLLFGGGEFLVRGSVAIATRYGISKLVVGLVIVGFGTSAPELLVSVQAALSGSPDISVGNVVGSNIANVLLIVGAAGLIAPVVNSDPAIRRDLIMMVAASLIAVALFLTGSIGRLAGAGLLAALAVYLFTTYALEQKRRRLAKGSDRDDADRDDDEEGLALLPALLRVVAGIVMLVVGARLMVTGAVGIARDFGVSEAVIGVTVVAIGTSLPELATALIAGWKRQSQVVLANVVGSNIFNILSILGATAVIAPIAVSGRFAIWDGPTMAAIAVAMLVYLFAFRTIGRPMAAVMLVAYAGYIVVQAGL